jgi:hypothetical protein
MRKSFVLIAVGSGVVLYPAVAAACIGPGVGAGAVAAVLGVLGSIFLAIVAVLYYPIKRLLKGRKPKAAPKVVSKDPAE